jgi:hypothetical protein
VGSHNAELVRVFARETGAVVADVTFPSNAPFEAVIECKVGKAIHNLGARYEIKIDVLDFSTMASIISSEIVANGFMGDAGWPNHAHQFAYQIAAPGIFKESHIWKIFASLKVGVTHPYVSFAESELLLISPP